MTIFRPRWPPAWLAAAVTAALIEAAFTIPLAIWLDADGIVVAVVAIALTALAVLLVAMHAVREARDRERASAELGAIWTRAPHPMLRVDRAGKVVGANPSAQALLGEPADRVEGKPLAEVLGGANGASEDAINDIVLNGDGRVEELAYQRGDGSETLVAVSSAPLRERDEESPAAIVFASDVGAERRARESERGAEARYRALVDAVPGTTYLHAPGERDTPLFVSRQAETMLGYSPDELVARPGAFGELVHPDDRERVEAELAAARRDERPFRCEYRVLSRTGRVVDVLDTALTVRGGDGTILCTQGFLADVSERRAAEEERDRLRLQRRRAVADARTSDRRLDLLAGATDLLANARAEQAAIESVSQALTRGFADWCIVDLVDDDGEVKRVAAAHAEPRPPGGVPGSDVDPEVAAVVRSGRPHVEDSRLFVPIASHERIAGVLTVLRVANEDPYDSRDLAVADAVARTTSLAIANGRLYDEVRRRAHAADVLTYVGDGVALVDRNGTIRLWNPAAEVIMGFSADAVLGRPAADAVPGWQLLADRVPLGSGDEIPHPEMLPLETPQGERWVSISGVEFFGGIVYAFRDLTEERRLEELRADFVATASHELRTPLAAVYGAAQTLRRHDFALDEAGRGRFVSMIVEESDRLGRIVNEILLASQLGSGRFELTTESFEPRDLVERVVESARTHAPPELIVEAAARETPAIVADREKIRQVLMNFVENAIKYSPDGGRVEVGADVEAGSARFWVRDEGLGIAPEEQALIFEKFYRVDPDMARGVGGTGLGLYICKELVERMGGRIWLDSERGRGSTFSFELPTSIPARESVRPDARASVS